MTRLHDLYNDAGQSPWLDNLKRSWIESGEIQRWVDDGVRGITSNPAIFAKAMMGSEYDEQLQALAAEGRSVEDCYWELVCADIEGALAVLRGVYDDSDGADGFVSVEVSPALADQTEATIEAARWLRNRISGANLLVKVPATAAGIPAIEALIAEGISINVTLIFTLERYAQVIEAYLAGLERRDGDLSAVASVASFFISRVDSAVDPLLLAHADERVQALSGTSAISQAALAYDMAMAAFSGPRWEALEARGARIQRPLWASTSTKNPAFPDTLYVDQLIGPNTVNTLPDATIAAFIDHGIVERTIDTDIEGARDRWQRIGEAVDLGAVGAQLESEGVDAFCSSFEDLLSDLQRRIGEIGH